MVILYNFCKLPFLYSCKVINERRGNGCVYVKKYNEPIVICHSSQHAYLRFLDSQRNK